MWRTWAKCSGLVRGQRTTSGASQFETKLSDIVGPYLDPAERTQVICVDEN